MLDICYGVSGNEQISYFIVQIHIAEYVFFFLILLCKYSKNKNTAQIIKAFLVVISFLV